MATRRFYWLKLNEDFFNRHDIKCLEKQERGHTLVMLYVKLMLLGINEDGELFFKKDKPFNCTSISMVTDTDRAIVEEAMQLYQELGMITLGDNGVYKLCDYEDLVGSETSDARRMRKARKEAKEYTKEQKTNKSERCSSEHEHCYIDIDIEKDKEKEIDKEIEKEIEGVGDINIEGVALTRPHTQAKNVIDPSLEEVKEYSRQRGDKVDAERFYDHYTAVGWRMGKQPIRDWKAAFRKWEKCGDFRQTEERSDTFNEGSRNCAQSGGSGSFDTDDFFEAALRRSYNVLPQS